MQQTINARKGQVIYLSRSSNPSTGYSYDIVLTPGLTLLYHEYIPSRSAQQGKPGSGGEECWSICVDGDNPQYIRLWYRRPWEKTTDAGAELITVNVV